MPHGFRRSRALWDETKRPQLNASSRAYALLCAILYELQPIRFSAINWSRFRSTAKQIAEGSWFAISCLPGLIRTLAKHAWQRKGIVAGVLLYYLAVRWIHDVLEAGPIVLIVTSLVAIFTVGLSDDSDNDDRLSAYSVFNRGFERLMGTVDADALVAQHVGLGQAAALNPGGAMHGLEPAGEAPRPQQPVRRRNNNRRIEEEENNDLQDDTNNAEPPPRNNNNNNSRARKSGKKARRRNLEQRREIRQQREAAMAMGAQGGETEEEVMAMQRLIEQQLENRNNQ
eukprot:scaffold7131_cov136-Cylindrotheca_fusiformis.AAC.1